MGSLNSRSSIFGGDQVRSADRRKDLRISNPGSSFNSFFEKKKVSGNRCVMREVLTMIQNSNVLPGYDAETDIELVGSPQVLLYRPEPNDVSPLSSRCLM